jgi:methyltransferase (TIGR00027 family)
VTAGVLLDARDPALAPLLPPRMRELAETAVAEFPSRGRRLLRSIDRGWYRALMRGIERVTAPGIFLHYLMRKLFIEEAVRRSLATPDSARQVVLIGAGLDTLGARLALDGASNVRVVEVDHPATQAVKRRALARYGLPREGFSFVELDLTVRTLAEALGDSDQLDPRLPAVFVAEGLLMYLTPERAADFFREVHQISAPGSRLVFTFMESDRNDRIRFKSVPWWYGPLLDFWLRWLGEPMRWAIDRSRLAGWLSDLGWTLETIADREIFRERYLAPRGLEERALLDGEYVAVAVSS